MNIPWADIEIFLAVAETRSFSEAARRLRVRQPTVSRRIAQLEETMGQKLFLRGVHGAVSTPLGERLLPSAQRMAAEAAELRRITASSDATPEGTVRVTAPPGVAWDFVVPMCAVLRRELPAIRLEVLSSVAYLDLARGEADIALRQTEPTQPDLVSLGRIEVPLGVYASPAYARTVPASAGLGDIQWVTWAAPLDHLPPRPQLQAAIPDFRPAFASDSFLVQWRAVEEGLGAMFLPRTDHPASHQRRLVRLELNLDPMPVGTLHVVATKSSLRVARVRAVAEFLADQLGAIRTV